MEIKSNPVLALTFKDEETDIKEIVLSKIKELENKILVYRF